MAIMDCRNCHSGTTEGAKKCSHCNQYHNPSAEIDNLKLDIDFLKNELLALKAQLANIPVAERV